jgi:hypothetical protein
MGKLAICKYANFRIPMLTLFLNYLITNTTAHLQICTLSHLHINYDPTK